MRQIVNNHNYSDAVCEVPPIDIIENEEPNVGSKTFTVPGNELWLLNWAHIVYISSDNAGTRTIKMEMLNSSDRVVMDSLAGVHQTAGLVRHYEWLIGIFRETAFLDIELQVPIPANFYIPAGYKLKFYDKYAIDPAGDQMILDFEIIRLQV